MNVLSRKVAPILGALLLVGALASCTRPDPEPPTTTMPDGGPGPGPGPVEGDSYIKGPAPTESNTTGSGSFSVTTASASGASGFGGGRLYSPTAAGTYGGIVLAPPFTVQNSANADTARFLASHGFVVLAYDAFTAADFPSSRARQGEAALRYLTETSSVRSKVDASRLAFGGFSMGGGATMKVANRNPQLKAAMPMVPWHTTKSFPNDRVPTLILAAQVDSVASTSSHAEPFYRSIPAGTPKTYVEDRGASHFMPMSLPGPLKRYAVSWMKRYVDNDQRYAPFTTQRDSSLSAWEQASVS
jgi:pimeloyl-ACP methyl ester carboxylesterase